jgi:hypothetical protein
MHEIVFTYVFDDHLLQLDWQAQEGRVFWRSLLIG